MMKKHILFVKGFDNEEDQKRIQEALEDTRLDFTLNLATQAVVIEGNADDVYVARTVLLQAGYLIK